MAHASKRKPERPWRSRQWGRTDTEEVLAQAFIPQAAPPAISASDDGTAPDVILQVIENNITVETAPGVLTSPGAAKAPDAITLPPALTAPPAVSVLSAKQKLVHKCTTVQHGHSITDQAVYQLLWGRGVAETPERPNGNRIIAMGVAQIAKQLGTIHERNVPIILNRLIGKQSIEIINREVSDEGQPRQYRAFGFEEILARRERLGLTHVVRSSRGVDFVNPQTKQPIPLQARVKSQTAPPAVSSSPAPILPADISASVPVIAPEGPDVSSVSPPVVSAASLRKELKEKSKETTPTEFSKQVLSWIPFIDQQAIDRIWRESHQLIPDLRSDELLEMLKYQINSMRTQKRLTNPIGFMIDTIPDWVRREG